MAKKFLVLVAVVCMLVAVCGISYGADSSASTGVTANVSSVFALELSKGAALAFTNVDGSQGFVLPDGRVNGDGKNDAEIICRTNLGQQWCLKVGATLGTGMTADNLLVYVPSNAYDRNKASGSNAITGGLSFAAGWYNIWTTPTKVYQDFNNAGGYNTTPNGTLITFSYALCPVGKFTVSDGGTPLNPNDDIVIGGGHTLASGSYTANITYTMTTTLT